ncbi:MAG: transposase [Gammaproteobacteria bacterium]|nr:transposase [Gammaproteobacteria bacterium]
MPRKGRLHLPGGRYLVIGRGLERRYIFKHAEDKEEFLARLGENLSRSGAQCLAWAMMSNHYYLLIRVDTKPLSKLMGPVLSGYAGYYNRRYRRAGYVFQNRF